MAVTDEGFDYIIVGAGSAGCVLANRLGEDPGARILIIEAGGRDSSPVIKIPLMWGLILKNRLFDWNYFTEPEVALNGRRIECARGKVLGGCTSINGMHHARGMSQDFDNWAQNLGLPAWSYANVLPYFKRSETWEGGASALRGGDGPLTVVTSQFADPLIDAFFNATDAQSYRHCPDYNGVSADGIGRMQMTIRRGLRCSAALAYLKPALARSNVTLRLRSMATKVLFEGSRAIGVEYLCDNRRYIARADCEVLLCGGVINSPQLLMLSGIGDPDQLSEHGIPVRASLKGVGLNLHDHLVVDVRYRRREPGTLHRLLRLDRLGIDLLKTLLFGTGVSGNVPATAVGLIRSRQHIDLPDAEIILAAAPMNAAPYLKPFKPPYLDAFAIKGIMLQPESRGQVLLASGDPTQAPLIRQNFLATDGDRLTMREIVCRMREIGAQEPLRSFVAEELAPGADQNSDEQIDEFVRRTAITLHHPVGTCKMGAASDEFAVLDQQLCVHGFERLRVIDGSAIPHIVRGPINAPIIMMAEMAADLLRKGAPSLNTHASAGPSVAGAQYTPVLCQTPRITSVLSAQ